MSENKYVCIDCGKKISGQGITGMCQTCCQSGSRNFNWKGGKKYFCLDCGKQVSKKGNKCKSCGQKGRKHTKKTIVLIKKGQEGRDYSYLEGDKNPAKRPEVRAKISKALEKRKGWKFDKVNKVHGNKGKRMGEANSAKRPEVRAKIKEDKLQFWKDNPEEKIKMSKRMKKLWKTFTYQKTMEEASSIKPNKPEQLLNLLLNKLFPNEYKFVGDYQFWLGGKNPDFMNINGQKKLIEMYGDYWHKNDNPQDRINHFKKYGFDTLVIWEHELKDNLKLGTILKKFHKEVVV